MYSLLRVSLHVRVKYIAKITQVVHGIQNVELKLFRKIFAG